MTGIWRALGASVLAAATLVTFAPTATAAVDASCSYEGGIKKLVTLRLPADDFDEGPFYLGRIATTKRIGFDSDDVVDWRKCGSATIENTNKIKVVGSQHSEDLIIILAGGMIGPGAAEENKGASEIEIVGDLADGTDRLMLLGGDGADRLAVHSRSSAAFNGDDDPDISLSGVDRWEMYGARGNDVLDGHGAPDLVAYGEEGSDRVVGGKGSDRLYGDGGEVTADGDDVVIGGDGSDDLVGGGRADRLVAEDGDDSLRGGTGPDALFGGPGGDTMYADSVLDGADEYNGGPGTDRVSYYDREAPVRLTLDGKPNDGKKGEGDLIRGDVENLTGGEKGDVIVGNGLRNSLYGEAGDDVLKGLGEDDSFSAWDGDDTVYGGDGDDSFSNSLGSDKFFGEGGNDYLSGGSSDDGRDVFSGGPGWDQMDFSGRSSSVTIDVASDNGDGAPGENDFVKADFERYHGGSAGDVMVGGPSGEDFYGNGGSDDISGGRGPDSINGGEGDDDLTGGEGYDGVYGGNGSDTLRLVDGAYDYGDCQGDGGSALVDAGVDDTDNCIL